MANNIKPGDWVEGTALGGIMDYRMKGIFISSYGQWAIVAYYDTVGKIRRKKYKKLHNYKKVDGKPDKALLAFAKKHDMWREDMNENIINKIDNFLNEKKEGKKSYDVRNIENETKNNDNFRNVLFTGKNLQLVLMSLNPGEEIGMEVHDDVDQFFRFDAGDGELQVEDKKIKISDGFSVVIPAGTKHNIVNTSDAEKLKLYTIYAPPNHPEGTIHKTKDDAMKDEEH